VRITVVRGFFWAFLRHDVSGLGLRRTDGPYAGARPPNRAPPITENPSGAIPVLLITAIRFPAIDVAFG
jgi:hypothetical protein